MSDTPTDERVARLAEQTFEDYQISNPKIQKVHAILRKNPNFAKYCIPRVISFGPIHYRNEDLKLGQQFKIGWKSLYIEEYSTQTNISTSEADQLLHRIVRDNIEELKNLFNEDVIDSYRDVEELTQMLFVDGCSLLYYMENVDQHPEKLKLKVDQLMYTRRDIGLLENQLPMRLLGLLSEKEWHDLEYLLWNFIKMRPREPLYSPQVTTPAHHILDYLRSCYIKASGNFGDEHNQMTPLPPKEVKYRFKNIRDLKKAGIRVRDSHSISFTSGWFCGELRLPAFKFDDDSLYFALNVIAYEMCPDFHNSLETCSRYSFLDYLIDDAADVKELKSVGVLQNLLRSDEELAKAIKEICNDLPTTTFHHTSVSVAYSKRIIEVKYQIEKHCKNKWKTWLAELFNTYFNTWGPVIAFLVPLLALILTSIQTWYAIHPKKN